jgi:hypothetical protein
LSWREQVNFQWDDDEVHFVLDQHAELDFYSASSLKQQSAGRHVAPLGHIILIPLFTQHENNAHSYDYKTIYNHSYIIQLLVIIKSKMNTHSSILHLIKFNYMYNIIMGKFVLSMKKMQEFVEILPIRIRIRILYWPIKDPQGA